ncbi:hypothetical protein ECO319P1_00012 [Escherichia phage ECO319P1]|nr:hypothetical protein ECO319P1_00012 [Escherichia phage ECO319P1]
MIDRKGFGIRMPDGSIFWFHNSNPRAKKV